MEALNYLEQVTQKEMELTQKFGAYALAIGSAGHHRLARQLAAEANAVVTTPMAYFGVRACLEDLLDLLQREIVPLVILALQHQVSDRRKELEAILANNERQLDWLEAQIYTIQELGEAHYLAGE